MHTPSTLLQPGELACLKKSIEFRNVLSERATLAPVVAKEVSSATISSKLKRSDFHNCLEFKAQCSIRAC